MNDTKIIDLSRKNTEDSELKNILKQNNNIFELDISETPISSLYFLKRVKLYNLEVLNISSTNIKDLSYLEELPNLKVLRANCLKIEEINFKKLTKLEKLSFEYSEVSNFQDIEYLKSLKYLSLFGNKWLKDLSNLAKLQNIEELYLEGTDIYSREELKKLENLPLKKLLVNYDLREAAKELLRYNYQKLQSSQQFSMFNLNNSTSSSKTNSNKNYKEINMDEIFIAIENTDAWKKILESDSREEQLEKLKKEMERKIFTKTPNIKVS